jgi:hypothetical protein
VSLFFSSISSLDLPKSFSDIAGIPITEVNTIKDQYLANNITAANTVEILDLLVQNFYRSSPNLDQSTYACDFNGLSALECENPAPTNSVLHGGSPLRAVTLAGVFVPAPWATGGTALTLDEATSFYTHKDFEAMTTMGLNTVQIPIPATIFESSSTLKVLKEYLVMAQDAGLKAILVITEDDDDSTTATISSLLEAAKFALLYPSVVLGLTLPTKENAAIEAMRKVAPVLPLFVPISVGDIETFPDQGDSNIYAALELSNSNSVADIASSSSKEDRSKLFYHEAISCVARAPLEFAACYANVGVFVSSGFDLSIDDCIHYGDDSGYVFKDYGQCDRFDETIPSPWWHQHRESFAARQLFAYERGLGWSFATWKIYGDDATKNVIDTPADLMALRTVAYAGLFPNLNESSRN